MPTRLTENSGRPSLRGDHVSISPRAAACGLCLFGGAFQMAAPALRYPRAVEEAFYEHRSGGTGRDRQVRGRLRGHLRQKEAGQEKQAGQEESRPREKGAGSQKVIRARWVTYRQAMFLAAPAAL